MLVVQILTSDLQKEFPSEFHISPDEFWQLPENLVEADHGLLKIHHKFKMLQHSLSQEKFRHGLAQLVLHVLVIPLTVLEIKM